MTHWNAGRKITWAYADWPKSMQNDWDAAFAGKRYGKEAKKKVDEQYCGLILQALERFLYFRKACRPEAEAPHLAQCLARDDVRDFAADLVLGEIVRPTSALAPTTIESYLDRLLAAAGRLDPHGDYKWLQRLTRKYRPQRRPPQPPPIDLEEMLDTGFEAMAEARAMLDDDALRAASGRARRYFLALYRDGLLLGWLALLGLRIGESLTLAQGVSFLINRAAPFYSVDFTVGVTKTGEAKYREVPTQLDEHVAYYLSDVRPGFPDADKTKSFWLGFAGPLGYQGAYAGLTKLTQRRATARANATDVRHAVADASRRRGDSKRQTAEIMGHRHQETAGRFYTAHKVLSDIAPLARKYGI